jgi:hypothetical protein
MRRARVAYGMGVVALGRRQAVAIAAAGIAAGALLFLVALSADDLSRPVRRAESTPSSST